MVVPVGFGWMCVRDGFTPVPMQPRSWRIEGISGATHSVCWRVAAGVMAVLCLFAYAPLRRGHGARHDLRQGKSARVSQTAPPTPPPTGRARARHHQHAFHHTEHTLPCADPGPAFFAPANCSNFVSSHAKRGCAASSNFQASASQTHASSQICQSFFAFQIFYSFAFFTAN